MHHNTTAAHKAQRGEKRERTTAAHNLSTATGSTIHDALIFLDIDSLVCLVPCACAAHALCSCTLLCELSEDKLASLKSAALNCERTRGCSRGESSGESSPFPVA